MGALSPAHPLGVNWSLGMLLAAGLLMSGCSVESPAGTSNEPRPSATTSEVTAEGHGARWSRQKTLDFATDKFGVVATDRRLPAIQSMAGWADAITAEQAEQAVRHEVGTAGAVLAVEPVVVTRQSLNSPDKPGQPAEAIVWLVALRTEMPKFSNVQVYARQQAGGKVRNPMVPAEAVAAIDALTGRLYFLAIS